MSDFITNNPANLVWSMHEFRKKQEEMRRESLVHRQTFMNAQELKMPDPSPEPEKTPQQREYAIRTELLKKIDQAIEKGNPINTSEWICNYKTFMEAINKT